MEGKQEKEEDRQNRSINATKIKVKEVVDVNEENGENLEKKKSAESREGGKEASQSSTHSEVQATINEIVEGEEGKTYRVVARVVSVRKTRGPTLFRLEDTSGELTAAAFQGKGVRAFPDIKDGDVVVAVIVKSYDRTRGSSSFFLTSMEKLSEEQAISFLEDLEKNKKSHKDMLLERVAENFEGKKKREFITSFLSALIDSITEGKSLIVRYHNDIDGFVSALLFRKLVFMLSSNLQKRPPVMKFHPMRRPWYDLEDALQDIQCSKGELSSFCLVLLDNGSTEDDIKALAVLKGLGSRVLIVDHHPPSGKISEIADGVLNPYLWGSDKNETTAYIIYSMLDSLAEEREEWWSLVASLSLIADKSKGEVSESFLARMREKVGEDNLEKLRWVLDYMITVMSGRLDLDFVKELLTSGKVWKIVNALYPAVKELIDSRIEEMESRLDIIENERMAVGIVDAGSSTRFYPPAGRSTGILFERMRERFEKEGKSVALFCFAGDSIIVRVGEGEAAKLFSKEFMEEAIRKYISPAASAGGHDVAYTIKVEESLHPKVREEIRKALSRG